MLGRELTIKNLKRQRDFILNQISILNEKEQKDGQCCYRYVGHVFPQVIRYLDEKHQIHGEFVGYNLGSSDFEAFGAPIYIFYPQTTITDTLLQKIGFYEESAKENDKEGLKEENQPKGFYEIDHEDSDGYAEELSQYM